MIKNQKKSIIKITAVLFLVTTMFACGWMFQEPYERQIVQVNFVNEDGQNRLETINLSFQVKDGEDYKELEKGYIELGEEQFYIGATKDYLEIVPNKLSTFQPTDTVLLSFLEENSLIDTDTMVIQYYQKPNMDITISCIKYNKDSYTTDENFNIIKIIK